MTNHLRIGTLKTKLLAAAIGALLAVCGTANATLVGYQTQAAFNAAIAGWSTTSTDFESVAVVTMFGPATGPAGSGFTMTLSGPDAPSMTPTVANQFWTTSGTNYLGLNNPDTAFEAGDSLTFNFGTAVHAFGLFVIGTADIDIGDIGLTAGVSNVTNSASADITDGNGSFAYFLGFVSDDSGTFSSVTLNDLTPQDPRLLNIAVDDVTLAWNDHHTTVPEPGTLALIVLGLLAFGIRTRNSFRQ